MSNGAIKLAVADDHERFRKALCTHLERMGFIVLIQASNGSHLIAWMQDNPILPDLVIVDVHMPGINGLDLTRLIRSNWPGIQVLLISIDNDPKTARVAIESGAAAFIGKGGDPMEIKLAIDAILNK